MRKLLYVAVALIALAVVAVLALPALIATDTIRNAVVTAVKDGTGRTLSIGGDVDVSIFPRIHIAANQVTLSNPPGFAAEFASMEQMEIELGLFSALSGKPEIDGFVLVKPRINLAVDKAGRNNWTFGTGGAAEPARPGRPDLGSINAANFEIVDGRLTYSNAQAGTEHTLANINLNVAMASASAPFTAGGEMLWNGQPVTLSVSLETLARLNGGQAAAFAAEIARQDFSAELSGNLTKRDGGFELAGAKFSTGGTTGTGTIALTIAAGRPLVAAALEMDRLNLSEILGGEAAGSTAGWSDRPIDFSALSAVDGDIDLAVREVRYGNIKTGAGKIRAKLRGGVLTANLSSLALYDGAASGTARIDSRNATPAVALKGELKDVNALPFLRDGANAEKIEGRFSASFDLTSAGASTQAIMAGLDGAAELNFKDGALLGIDIASILRAVAGGRTSGFAKGGKTPFGAIVAGYRFNNGEGVNNNLRMSGGEVLITGGGSVSMPRKTLSYRVNPSLVGQGGITVVGINVPIIVAGPWANPKVYPDLPGILDAPEMALKGLAIVGEGGAKGVTDILEKVVPLGPDSGSGSGSNPIGKIFKSPF